MNDIFGRAPSVPRPSPTPMKVDHRKSIWARDEVLRRLAKMRRATMVSQLSTPNVKRKQLGAGV